MTGLEGRIFSGEDVAEGKPAPGPPAERFRGPSTTVFAEMRELPQLLVSRR